MESINETNHRIRKRMSMSTKLLWKGTFNYRGKKFILYTQTYTRDNSLAFYSFCFQLSEKLEMLYTSTRDYFLSNPDQYTVKKMNRKKDAAAV